MNSMPADENGRPESGEFDIIRRHFAPLAHDVPGSFDLRDDAAVLHPRDGQELVLTADAMVAGVHFLPDDPAGDIARKLLRVNLSDIAAMGAEPLVYLLTTAYPHGTPELWIADFAAGLAADQRQFGIRLAGGDTVATDGPLTLSLTAIGTLPIGSAIRRSTARAGDLVFVSGSIGDAGAGLALLQGAAPVPSGAQLIARYRLPEPRTELGPALRGLATACVDVSDGLVADLGHIASASRVAATVDMTKVPVSAVCRQVSSPVEAIVAGDDYELLFTVRPEDADRAEAAASTVGVPVTCIGAIAAGEGVAVRGADGAPIELPRSGFRHF